MTRHHTDADDQERDDTMVAATSEIDDHGSLPRLVGGSPAGMVFGLLSAARRRRVFHPDGVAYRASLEVTPVNGGADQAPLLRGAGRRPAVVRLSRGVGLPRILPDIHGFALKVPDADGRGGDQDMLLVTAGSARVARHLLVPTRGFDGWQLSSLLLFQVGTRRVVLGARLCDPPPPAAGRSLLDADASGLRFELALAAPSGDWERFGTITLTEVLPPDESRELRFNPWNDAGGITPVGPLNWLRDAAYRGSQVGRPT